MLTSAPPGWTYFSAPRIGSPGVQVEYCTGFTVGAGLNSVRCTPTRTSCAAAASGPSNSLSQLRVEENQLVAAMVAWLGAGVTTPAEAAAAVGADVGTSGEASALAETAGAGLPDTAATDTAATRAGVSRFDLAAAETGWLAGTERDVAAGDRPGAAVRTAAVDLDVAVVPPGAAAALAETRAEEVSVAVEV